MSTSKTPKTSTSRTPKMSTSKMSTVDEITPKMSTAGDESTEEPTTNMDEVTNSIGKNISKSKMLSVPRALCVKSWLKTSFSLIST